MHDRELLAGYISEVLEAIRRIERRFEGVASAEEFIRSDEGLDRLDAIAMMLIAIGENIKKVDKITDGRLLPQFPEIPWQGVKGTRDVIAHDYFGIDHEEIFNICTVHLAPLKQAILQLSDGL